MMSNKGSSSLSWSTKKSLMLKNLAGNDTTLAKGSAERCQTMMSLMLWNLADDDTMSAEGLTERCRSMMSSTL